MTIQDLQAMPQQERQAKFLEIFNSKKRDFSMFTPAGNRKVQALVKECSKKILGKKAFRQKEFEDFVSAEVKKVLAQGKFSEIGDTAVRECIYFWIEKAIKVAGYDWPFFEYKCY